ncbi:MAG: DUF1192 domain-containing protein [Pseudomonadota bacterium]
MADEDRDASKKPNDRFFEAPLEDLSIEELEERIVQLAGEIEKCRRVLKTKQASMTEAEAFFKQ